MKADYLSYKRATTVSLLGLALQLAMGLGLLAYAVIQRDHLAQSISYFVLSGSVVWLMLTILFDQHRRERIEELETQALLGSGARESSAFSEGADDFRVAAKRLVWMYRILVPVVSIGYALVLAGIGLWRFSSGQQFVLDPDKFVQVTLIGWPIGLGLAMAAIGFFFARYAAGMAKQPVWANLRAGAAVSVGAALFGLALMVGHLLAHYAKVDSVIRYLHVIVPAAMIVLAAEVVINFVLSIYSPRRPGEFPRPAFDSRILGFVAAPDRIAESIGEAINYQFGFDVTSSWFYQLLSRSLLTLVLTGLLVLWLLTSVAVVQPNEQGLRVRFGERIGEALGPGPYFKLPWPMERIERVQTTIARRINLGGDQPKLQNKAILWTTDHGTTEVYFAVQHSIDDRKSAAERSEADSAARDFSLVAVEIPLVYTITDLVKFEEIGSADQRENIIKAIGRREAFRLLATENVDSALGEGRKRISAELRKRIEAELQTRYGGAGIRILFVGIEGVHPPRDTAAAFEGVVQGRQMKAGAIETAQKDANDELINVAGSVEKARAISNAIAELDTIRSRRVGESELAAQAKLVADAEAKVQDLLVKAGGTAASAIHTARADRWVRHMEARGRAASYVGQTAGFKAAPEVFAAQQYFDAVRTALTETRVYIVAGDGNVEVRTNLEDITTGGALFNLPKPRE